MKDLSRKLDRKMKSEEYGVQFTVASMVRAQISGSVQIESFIRKDMENRLEESMHVSLKN